MQEHLIKLNSLLIELLKDISEDELRAMVYSCLKRVYARTELRLEYLGYEKEFSQLLRAKGNETITDEGRGLTEKIKILSAKNNVSLTYQRSLYEILHLCLDKLERKNLQDKALFLIGNFFTIAFYRIPKFRTAMISLLQEIAQTRVISEYGETKLLEIEK